MSGQSNASARGLAAAAFALLLLPSAALAQVDADYFVAEANQSGAMQLRWTNAPVSDGVLVVRREGLPANPNLGKNSNYSAGQVLSDGSVVVAAPAGTTGPGVTSFLDAFAFDASTQYHYKVFNAIKGPGSAVKYNYSAGTVPTPNGLMARQGGAAPATPGWCYSVGLPNLGRPVIADGKVFAIGNLGAITVNQLGTGAEALRPIPLQIGQNNTVQARPVAGSWFTGSGGVVQVVTGDQQGRAYRFNGGTGANVWTNASPFGAGVALPIQASPTVRLQAAAGEDYLFFGSMTGSNNAVSALRFSNGAAAWTFRPGDLASITGESMVDPANDRLWVPTTAATNPVRILNVTPPTAAGQQVAQVNGDGLGNLIGPVDHGIVGGMPPLVLITARNGVWAFDRNTLDYVWHVPLASAPTAHVLPLSDGFVVGLADNTVVRYVGASLTVAPTLFATASLPARPATVRAFFSPLNKFIVPANNGTIYQLDPAAGTMPHVGFTFATGPVSAPAEDPGTNRAMVGTNDGRVCSIGFPL